jgi:hypothetical protein
MSVYFTAGILEENAGCLIQILRTKSRNAADGSARFLVRCQRVLSRQGRALPLRAHLHSRMTLAAYLIETDDAKRLQRRIDL